MALRLYKKQKLCSTLAIDALFGRGEGVEAALSFPLRAVWRQNPGRHSSAPVQFLISVPKKRLRHAVDRVKMRRRIREAFRLNWQDYPWPEGARVDVAFVYVDSGLQPYAKVDKAMKKLLQCVSASCGS
ncbi:MAG: ribonuclease P protein component [Bacteroidales bacterium]|nr:ribonuclease P protein component [Bacteroidales bacterium]